VSPGSEAESAGLMDFDLLLSAGDGAADSLEALGARARMARATDQPLELMLLRLTPETHEALFLHERRLLQVDELEEIGR